MKPTEGPACLTALRKECWEKGRVGWNDAGDPYQNKQDPAKLGKAIVHKKPLSHGGTQSRQPFKTSGFAMTYRVEERMTEEAQEAEECLNSDHT